MVAPPVQVYVGALPVPVKVAVCPLQKVGWLTAPPTVGNGWIEMDVAALAVPQAFCPVTVYPDVLVGAKTTPFVTEVPPDQV